MYLKSKYDVTVVMCEEDVITLLEELSSIGILKASKACPSLYELYRVCQDAKDELDVNDD